MDTGKIMKRTVLFILISLCAFLVACHAKDAPEKAETTTSNTSSVSDILTETTSPVLAFDEKFQQYLDLLGIESDGYFEGTEEFIRSLESAQFMGISGSITYGFTENSNSTIDLMTWIINSEVQTWTKSSDTLRRKFWNWALPRALSKRSSLLPRWRLTPTSPAVIP